MFSCTDFVYLKQKSAYVQCSTQTSGASARQFKRFDCLKVHEILVRIELVYFSYITTIGRGLCLYV